MISANLKKKILAKDIAGIRNNLYGDMSVDIYLSEGGIFDNDLKYCLENGISEAEIFEVDDGRELPLEITKENMTKICAMMGENFSKEKFEAARKMGKQLAPVRRSVQKRVNQIEFGTKKKDVIKFLPSENLKRKVLEKNICGIRNNLYGDMSVDIYLSEGGIFDNDLKYCLENGIREEELFEVDDGRELSLEITKENMTKICSMMGENFSKEKLEVAKKIGKRLLEIKRERSEKRDSRIPKTSESPRKEVLRTVEKRNSPPVQTRWCISLGCTIFILLGIGVSDPATIAFGKIFGEF